MKGNVEKKTFELLTLSHIAFRFMDETAIL